MNIPLIKAPYQLSQGWWLLFSRRQRRQRRSYCQSGWEEFIDPPEDAKLLLVQPGLEENVNNDHAHVDHVLKLTLTTCSTSLAWCSPDQADQGADQADQGGHLARSLLLHPPWRPAVAAATDSHGRARSTTGWQRNTYNQTELSYTQPLLRR